MALFPFRYPTTSETDSLGENSKQYAHGLVVHFFQVYRAFSNCTMIPGSHPQSASPLSQVLYIYTSGAILNSTCIPKLYVLHFILFHFHFLIISGSPDYYDKETFYSPPPNSKEHAKPMSDHRQSRWFNGDN